MSMQVWIEVGSQKLLDKARLFHAIVYFFTSDISETFLCFLSFDIIFKRQINFYATRNSNTKVVKSS